MRTMMARFVAAVLVLCVVGVARADERWFVVALDGARVGWSSESVETGEDGGVVTRYEMRYRIGRMDSAVEIGVVTAFAEDADGEPLWMEHQQTQRGEGAKTRYEWIEEGGERRVRVITENSGRVTREVVDAPGGRWLTPNEVRAFTRERMEAGAERIVYRSIDPSGGLAPTLTTMARVGEVEREVLGRALALTRWTMESSAMAGLEILVELDAAGEAVRTEFPLGAMSLTMEIAERGEARKPLGDVAVPALMRDTLVSPIGSAEQIAGLRRSGAVRYVLRSKGGGMPDLPSGAHQRVERIDEGALRVTVRVGEPMPVDMDGEERQAYLGATTFADSGDPEIRALAARLVEGVGEGDRARAEALRAGVHRFITNKSLGVAFATASEVVRKGEGDCTEHAVLLAALLRAEGIPSRAANGLLFVERMGGAGGERNVFGYHMWAQALLPTKDGGYAWTDLDAVLPPGGGAAGNPGGDATHLVFSYTDLTDGGVVSSMGVLSRLLGNLEIEIEAVAGVD